MRTAAPPVVPDADEMSYETLSKHWALRHAGDGLAPVAFREGDTSWEAVRAYHDYLHYSKRTENCQTHYHESEIEDDDEEQ